MKSARILFILAGLFLLAAMVMQTKLFDANAMGSLEPTRKGVSSPPVHARIAAEGRVTTYPGAHVIVGTDAAGTLTRLLVQEKSRVVRGQIIGEIRAEDTRAALELARTRMSESEADIRLYEAELRRASNLYEQEVGTKQAVDRTKRDLESATARRETDAADVRRIEAVLHKTVIRAPISGTVLERLAQPGESLNEQVPVVSIADLRKIRIEAEVDEFDAGRVALGAPVILRAEGYNNQEWKGRVEEIPDTVVGRRLKPEDPGRPTDTRVLLVKIALDGPTPLKLGQRVEVEIQQQP
jgi:HlyD family secretion protein